MPDPSKHADKRNFIESVLRYIPGFHGYLEKGYRRESDSLARKWLSDRLEKSKPALDEFMRQLVDAGNLAALAPCERVRSRLDRLIGRFRGAPSGYSGMFDFVRIREAELDQVYQVDMALIKDVESLGQAIESLQNRAEEQSELIPRLLQQMEETDRLFDKRGEILSGISDQG